MDEKGASSVQTIKRRRSPILGNKDTIETKSYLTETEVFVHLNNVPRTDIPLIILYAVLSYRQIYNWQLLGTSFLIACDWLKKKLLF